MYPPEWCHSTTCLLHKKVDPTILDNYRPIALMNNLLKLWTALIIKDAGSKYAETHGILRNQHDGFVYISLRRVTSGHIYTLDSGGVLPLHL
jgi:hypothetical protein